jgi:hypothetical protein
MKTFLLAVLLFCFPAFADLKEEGFLGHRWGTPKQEIIKVFKGKTFQDGSIVASIPHEGVKATDLSFEFDAAGLNKVTAVFYSPLSGVNGTSEFCLKVTDILVEENGLPDDAFTGDIIDRIIIWRSQETELKIGCILGEEGFVVLIYSPIKPRIIVNK